MTTSESKGRYFLQNESIRITNRIDSNRELECSTCDRTRPTAVHSGEPRVRVSVELVDLYFDPDLALDPKLDADADCSLDFGSGPCVALLALQR